MLCVIGRFTSILLLAALLVGCAGRGGELPALEAADLRSYKLDSGDVIRVFVFGSEELSREYTVDGVGTISFPLVGPVDARGLSTHEFEERLAQRLNEGGIIRNPSISVQVVTPRPVYVLGEVQQPGQFPFVHGMTVLTAVALAGGYTYRAEEDYVSITRKTGDEAVEGRAAPNSFVQPGDVIYVHERFF